MFCEGRCIVEGEHAGLQRRPHSMHASTKSPRRTCTQPRVRLPLSAESKATNLETIFATGRAGVSSAGIACHGRRCSGASAGDCTCCAGVTNGQIRWMALLGIEPRQPWPTLNKPALRRRSAWLVAKCAEQRAEYEHAVRLTAPKGAVDSRGRKRC